jgi:hypothetical protein
LALSVYWYQTLTEEYTRKYSNEKLEKLAMQKVEADENERFEKLRWEEEERRKGKEVRKWV